MTPPVGLAEKVQADEITEASGHAKGPTDSTEYRELLNQINGEGKTAEVELGIGGYVTIPLSTYNWTLVHAEYPANTVADKELARGEFVDAGGHTEAVLLIDRHTGEVWSVQVSRRNESFVQTITEP